MITNWKTILLISLILMVELVSYQPAQADEDEEGNTETTEDVSSEAVGTVEDTSNDINEAIENINSDIETTVEGTLEDIQSQDAVQEAQDTINEATDTIGNVQDTIGNVQDTIGDTIDNVTGIVDDIGGLFDDIVGGFGGGDSSSSGSSSLGIGGSIQSFFRDISGWISSEPQTNLSTSVSGNGASLQAQRIQSAQGAAKIPDLKLLRKQIMEDTEGGSPGQRLSQGLETKGSAISYDNRDDYNQQIERRAIRGIAYGSAISQEAQQQMIERQEISQTNTKRAAAVVANSIEAARQSGSLAQGNQKLAEESQELDVTQQIMQNISAQTGLVSQQEFAQSVQLSILADQNGRISQTNQAILEEQYQGRIDRSYENILNAQIAKEIQSTNISSRRRSISAGNQSSQQLGYGMLPGNRPLISKD